MIVINKEIKKDSENYRKSVMQPGFEFLEISSFFGSMGKPSSSSFYRLENRLKLYGGLEEINLLVSMIPFDVGFWQSFNFAAPSR